MDAVSYSLASKQAQRIEKFIENPDSTSGIVTVPKTIESGETVTVPAGRVAVLPNVVVDGTLNIDGEVFIPSGSSVDFSNGIKIDGNNIALSIPTSYHLLQGDLSVSNEVITNGFGIFTYTGNSTTPPSINLGMDITSQWGNDASETFGYLIKIKSRNSSGNWTYVDSVRGITKYTSSSTTAIEGTDANMFTLNTVAGVTTLTLGSSTRTNVTGTTYVVEVYQTTHRISGTTNHNKAYTCHYNPTMGFSIDKYAGSGLVGHEIPHSLGRPLEIIIQKNLNADSQWLVSTKFSTDLGISTPDVADGVTRFISTADKVVNSMGTGTANVNGNQTIVYGWANSYLDETNKLIGNYEIGVYQGTGLAGNKVTTRGKPAWVMAKRLESTGNWWTLDVLRNAYSNPLYPNLPNIESNSTLGSVVNIDSSGFTIVNTATDLNASGGQYLYMVVYDNDSGSGKSKYPKATDTSNVQINNAIIPLAHGVDSNGSKNSIVVANETITGLTYTQGKNYLYKTDTGYGVKSIQPSYGKINPLIGDFYNVITNKWYSNTNVEITESRNYLNHIVHADQNGQVTYVEELPKIEYKDVIKANEYQGKNACTAWANVDMTTTPPTIRYSYNISIVIRTATGIYDIYFEEPMDNINYTISHPTLYGTSSGTVGAIKYLNKVTLSVYSGGTLSSAFNDISITIFGGRN